MIKKEVEEVLKEKGGALKDKKTFLYKIVKDF
jgi:hypothetical protein